ncbi:MAG: DUF3489 domain-containing protein [Acidobacteriales bacterium]|nr:DUF3489 domain-containing protein [Terriglobales bacterium]
MRKATKKVKKAVPATSRNRRSQEKKVARPATEQAATPTEPKAQREGTAKATVLAMIQRDGGATLDEIRAATGWQPHTVRGFISVAPKRAGLTVTSTRRAGDNARVYEAH